MKACYTCHKCTAREMSQIEYRVHLAIVHNIALRVGRTLALALR